MCFSWYTSVMALKISERKQFLAERKSAGRRVTIGFTGIADLRSFIGLEYMKGMMKAAADYDINFINMGGAVKYSLFDDINFISHYIKNFRFMREPFVDGLVTWASSLWEFMEERNIISLFSGLRPLPMVDIGHVDIPGATMLKIDSDIAIRSMMEHLALVHGYTKFAFLGADISEPHRNRFSNYKKELARLGLSDRPHSAVLARSMNPNHIADALDEICSNFVLRGGQDVQVIVTSTDVIATEVIDQLSRRGISVPKDVAVTGFNNWYEGITARSPLTTIDLAYFRRGYTAVEILIDKLVSPSSAPRIVRVVPSLVIRQSCGCFEECVARVSSGNSEGAVLDSFRESEDTLRERLSCALRDVFPFRDDDEVSEMLDAFFSDVYEGGESRMLRFFQQVLQNYRKVREFDGEHFQNVVSRLRSLLLPVLKNEGDDVVRRMEDSFHQMRSLVSVYQKYESFAERENPYRLNNISEQAVSFVSASSREKVFDALRYQLGVLDIPGVSLALSENMGYNFPTPSVEFVFPEPPEKSKSLMHRRISEPYLFPKELFDRGKRYCVMLEILHHADRYFGYAFFEMKSLNIATYDVLRMLLSNALYLIYRKEGRTREVSFSVRDDQLKELISVETEPPRNARSRLTVEKITDYLTEHIGEMTNIDKMSSELMVSRSYLSRRTKELTGLSVQTLHERLKMEQAKNMLLLDSYELSEIASSLGFKDQNYFSNVFKKNTGLSPRNWLKSKA